VLRAFTPGIAAIGTEDAEIECGVNMIYGCQGTDTPIISGDGAREHGI